MSRPSYLNTAQNVNLEHKLADLGTRIAAYLIDFIIKFGYMLFIFILISASGMIESPMLMSFFFLPIMLYTLLFEIFNEGQTPGKKAQNIQVISADGAPVSIGQYFTRWLFCIIDFYLLSWSIALISIGASNKNQRLGDIVANTLVISNKQAKRLEDTGYQDYDESYMPTYPSVTNLSSEDIRIIREVLSNNSKNAFTIVTQTSNRIELILNVKKTESSRSFLNRVIKDFNYYQRVG